MEITNGRVRISAGYSAKIPGGAPYSSEDKHTGISIEFDVEGDINAITEQALALEADLDTKVKLATIASLGMGFTETQLGVIVPEWPGGGAPAPAPAQFKGPSGRGGGRSYGAGGGGGGQQFAPPKVEASQIPTFPTTLNGAQVMVQDCRSLKGEGKPYSVGAADFRIVGGESVWLFHRGTTNKTEDGAYLESVSPFSAG